MTTVNGILKEVYEGGLNNQLQDDMIALKRIEASSAGVFEDAGGKYTRFPIRVTRNAGISYRSENIALAAAGRQGYLQTQESLAYGYGRVRLTGQVIELADSNPKAFVNAADQEMEGLRNDLGRDSNRIAWGYPVGFATTSGTGTISRVTTGAASLTITAPLNNQIEVGMVIDLLDAAGVPITNGTGKTVLTVAANELSFTVDGSTPTTVTNVTTIARTGNWNKEPYGLSNLVSPTGALHGLNPATAGQEVWAALENSTTTTLTEPAMITMCDDIYRKGGARPSVVFCSLGVRRAYFNLLTSMRRYNEPKEWTGGLVGLAFNYEKEIPVVSDRDCPTSSMYMIDESKVKIYRNKPWHWADNDGSILKYVHDYDAWEALMKCYWQLVTHQRNSAGRFTALTEAS
jgi:hypothetical protein